VLLLLLLLQVLRGALYRGSRGAGVAAAVGVQVRVRVGMRGQLRRLIGTPAPGFAQLLRDAADAPAGFAVDLCENLEDFVLFAARGQALCGDGEGAQGDACYAAIGWCGLVMFG